MQNSRIGDSPSANKMRKKMPAIRRQLLFVQGGGVNAHDAWDNKLVESLKRELGPGYEIRYPRMPDEDNPRFARWKAALLKELGELEDGAVLVAHSIGAAILVHSLAEEPPMRPLAGIFLISMPFIGKDGWPSDEIKPQPDLGARLPAQSPVYLYQGSDDKTVPIRHAALNAKAMPQAVVRTLPGRDHQLDDDMSDVAADIRKLCSLPSARSPRILWTGWVVSSIPSLLLLSGSITAWLSVQQVVTGITSLGYSRSFIPVLGTLEFICAGLFLIPRTAFIGAILMSAYFGSAVATHVRVQDSEWWVPVAFGVLAWIGLTLRKPSLVLSVLGGDTK
jgi:predicted alpha/beta hydrolase family esterase